MPDPLVASLANSVDVLRVLSTAPRGLSNAEIATRTGTTRATARRLLLTLQELGYVRGDGSSFRLRPRVMEIGQRYLGGLGLPDIARPHLEELCARVNDTCSLTILDGDSVVYVSRVKAQRMMAISIAVGTRLAAYRVSSGRAMLATLPAEELDLWISGVRERGSSDGQDDFPADFEEVIRSVRADGYALVDRDFNPMLRSIAAPVLGADGRAVAAVNVSTAVSRTTTQQLREEVLPELLQTTAAISAAWAD